jgi:hypothetical protein
MRRMGLLSSLIVVLVMGSAGCYVRVATGPTQTPPVSRLLDTEAWSVLFSDDFDRAEPGPKWTPSGGLWSIESGALKGVLKAAENSQIPLSIADVGLQGTALPETVEIRYESWSPDAIGSEAKLLDGGATQGLILALYGTPHPALGATAAVIFLQSAGRYQISAANRGFEFKPKEHHRVRIVRQPDGVTVFVDGQRIASAAIGGQPQSREMNLHLAGSFGKIDSVVFFDKLEIRVPPTGKTPAK